MGLRENVISVHLTLNSTEVVKVRKMDDSMLKRIWTEFKCRWGICCVKKGADKLVKVFKTNDNVPVPRGAEL
jgi:hypothetical protein